MCGVTTVAVLCSELADAIQNGFFGLSCEQRFNTISRFRDVDFLPLVLLPRLAYLSLSTQEEIE